MIESFAGEQIITARLRDKFNIDLDPLTRKGHLNIRFRFVRLFLRFINHIHALHQTIKADNMAGIATLDQTAPKLNKAQRRIAPAHIFDKLYFRWCMLVGMRMRPFRLAGERFDSTIITFQPKIDVGTSSVIFAGRFGDPMF